MTSKNFSSKAQEERRLAVRLCREKTRRSLWSLCLFGLLLFFCMTLPTAIGTQQTLSNQKVLEWTTEQTREAGAEIVAAVLGLSNGVTALIAAGMAVVMAAASFRYLHNKSQVDFYHSLPIRRPYLFAANFGAGLAGFAAAYFSNLLLSGLIAVCAGFGGGLLTPAVGEAIVLHCVFFATIYALCVLGHQLAGTLATGMLCGGVLLVGPVAGYGLYFVCAEFFFEFFYLPEELALRGGDLVSPLWAYLRRTFHSMEDYAGAVEWGAVALGWLSVGLVLAVLGCWFYCRRPSESAGKAAAFRVPAAILKYFAVLLCTLTCGMFFWGTVGGRGWMFVGFFLGGLISHCLVEMIYHLDFKALFCHIRGFGLFALLFAAFYSCLALDVFHYDDFLPQADQVQAVSLDAPWLDKDYRGYTRRSWGDMEALERQTYREPETIASALNICALNWDRGEGQRYTASVRFTMKNGRQIYRRYLIPWEQAEENSMVLFNSEEYKLNQYGLYQKEAAQYLSAEIDQGMPQRPRRYLRQEGQAEALAQALQLDLQAMRAQDIADKGPVALVTLSSNREYGKKDYQRRADDCETVVPVYDSYVNTLRVMEEQGAALEPPLAQYEIESARVYVEGKEEDEIRLRDLAEGLPASAAQDVPVGRWVKLQDWETVQALIQQGSPDYLAMRNPFFHQDENVRLQVIVDEERGESIIYVFPKSSMFSQNAASAREKSRSTDLG